MALTYRTGSDGKGSALTIEELDNNFRHFTGSHSITGSLTISGSCDITGSLNVSGSITTTEDVNLTGSFTGSFNGIGSGSWDGDLSGSFTGSLEGAIVAPQYGSGIVAGTATYNLSVDATGKIIETPDVTPTYSSFICLLSQTGATDPQPNNVLENSLGITSPYTDFSRLGPGEYNLNAPNKFKLLKTILFINNGINSQTANITWEVVDTSNIKIYTNGIDGAFVTASLEIRTYN